MSYTKLKSYATNAIGNILPLDKEICQEMIEYSLTLSSDNEIQSHFLNLLGESEESLKFISKFLKLKQEADSAESSPSPLNRPSKNIPKKTVTTKPISNDRSSSTNAWSTNTTKATEKPSKGRLDKNMGSKTTSELLDLKPSNQLSSQQAKKSKKKNIDNLKDIEAVLNELEISREGALDSDSSTIRRVCNCMGTRHPLLEAAPNCMNCGKIICAKEGLQPCSFCGQDLISFKDKREIITILNQEKKKLIHKQDNLRNKKVQEQQTLLSNKQKNKKIVVTMNAGENLWEAQDKALKKIEAEKKKVQAMMEKQQKEKEEIAEQENELQYYERTSKVNPDLLKAQERLDTLLNYQDTGAERTKIIDNAADFEMPNSSNSGNMWLSPIEIALRLKKQQRQLRKYDEEKSSRTGRSKKMVEMVIKDGKVTMVEKHMATKSDDEGEDSEIKELENEIKKSKLQDGHMLSHNIWDYEKETNKWEKPVYINSDYKEESINPTPQQEPKSRVQFANDAESDELIVSIPS